MGRKLDPYTEARNDRIDAALVDIKRSQGAVVTQFGELREEMTKLGVAEIGRRLWRLEVAAGLRSPDGTIRDELPVPY